MREPVDRRLDPVVVGSLVLRAALVLVAVRAAQLGRVAEDLQRFRELGAAPGIPYRDFQVEYAPLELVLIRLVASHPLVLTAGLVALVAFLSDVATWYAVNRGFGASPARVYLLLGTPLLVFLYTRLDLVPIALAAWGAALAVRRRERISGVAFAGGVLTKVWPLALLPALWIRGQRTALWWSLGVTALGGLVWFGIAGAEGVRQVAGFRGATGWEIESVVGSLVWISGGGPVRLEAGAPRVGTVPPEATVALAVLLVSLQAFIWFRARSAASTPFGAASAAAVCALLVCAPVFSLQYAAWILPWAAIAHADGDRRIVRLVAAIEVLTGVLFVLSSPDRIAISKALIILRNALVIAVVLVWLWSTRASIRAPEAEPARA